VYYCICCSALVVLAVVVWSWVVNCVHCVKGTVRTVTLYIYIYIYIYKVNCSNSNLIYIYIYIYIGINPVLQAASKDVNESQPNKFEF